MTRRPASFPGGLHPDDHKAVSNGRPIVEVPLGARYVVPLRQHRGAPAHPVVRPGDAVLRGQPVGLADGWISAAVHAPTSGHVLAVEPRPVAHPSGLPDLCVVIEADGRDLGLTRQPVPWQELSGWQLCRRLTEMGLAGLGGAVFPTLVKLEPTEAPVSTLILNGAECEPWITCDDRLMRERPAEILRGAAIMRHALGARELLIGIEDNKPEAAAALRAAASALGLDLSVVVVPTRYPSGGAKQLTQLLTGRETPSGELTTEVGVQVFNVATAHALFRAVEVGEPLLTRVVTVTGHVRTPGNYEVRIGTPIADLLRAAGGDLPATRGHLVGGPLMGFALGDTAAPVSKACNCIIATHPEQFPDHPPPLPCIRCGACARACPAGLQPFEMYWYARVKDFDKANAYHLFDCIECGCCSYVCPSHIPLVDYYRYAKGELLLRDQDRADAELSRQRHEFRLFRLEREKQERAERLKKVSTTPLTSADPAADAKRALIQAAVERAKRNKEGIRPRNTEDLSQTQLREIEAIEARRAGSRPAAATPPAADEEAAA